MNPPIHKLASLDAGTGQGDPHAYDGLHIVGWPDLVIDALGHDPRSWYVEQFWLGVIGPMNSQFETITVAQELPRQGPGWDSRHLQARLTSQTAFPMLADRQAAFSAASEPLDRRCFFAQ
jgi:hypothetical protein